MIKDIIVIVVAALIVDWILCGKLAAIASRFHYRYRPALSRFVMLALLVSWIEYVKLYRPDRAYIFLFLSLLGLMILAYFLVAYRDVMKQNIPGPPPRYSDRESDL